MSDEIALVPAEIVSWLKTQQSLEGIVFLTEFPAVKKATPIKKPVVAVGIENITLSDHFSPDENGVLQRDEYCRTASIKVKFGIHVPFSQGGAQCHTVFTNIIDCLTFNSDFDIVQSECSVTKASRDTGAFVTDAYALINASFCPAETIEENYHCFIDKTFFCGSHITDNDIHVTLADKNKWNGIINTGIYIGNGTMSRTVNLGFKPRAVFVGGMEHPPMTTNFQTNMISYWGFAVNEYNSMGLQITSNGFKVLSDSTQVVDGVYPRLNLTADTYFYIALK